MTNKKSMQKIDKKNTKFNIFAIFLLFFVFLGNLMPVFAQDVGADMYENGNDINIDESTTTGKKVDPDQQSALNEVIEGSVIKILEEKTIIAPISKGTQLYQKLEIVVTHGSIIGKTIIVENGNLEATGLQKYKVGDDVVINFSKDFDNNNIFVITDYVRRSGLLILFLTFIIVAILIGKLRGLTSLVAMGLSFVVIFKFILPQIYLGHDPMKVAIIGALIIVPITFFLSHGFNKKTVVAIIGTIVSLFLTAALAWWFAKITKLTGFGTEDINFLQDAKANINIKDLMLAGIVIGSLGILNDITISQSAIVLQLKEASNDLTVRELYGRAMKVGHDHIASMINTLVLVYSGAALPLLLLFINGAQPFTTVINMELVADEIVKTLVISMGLILAVPITTFLAALIFGYKKSFK